MAGISTELDACKRRLTEVIRRFHDEAPVVPDLNSRDAVAEELAEEAEGLVRLLALRPVWGLSAWLGLGLGWAGLSLAVITGLWSGDVRDRRLATCDGSVVLPVPVVVMAWLGVVCGIAALGVFVAALPERRSPTGVFLVLTALAALLLEVLFLAGARPYMAVVSQVCSG